MTKKGIIFRASTILSMIGVLLFGVTFAQQEVTATLTDNTFASSTANLQVASDQPCTTFGATAAGFTFKGLIIGAAYQAGTQEPFCLKNVSGDGTKLSIGLNVTGGTNTNLDPTKVDIQIVDTTKSTTTDTTLDALQAVSPVLLTGLDGSTSTANIADAAQDNFTINVKLLTGAITSGKTASLSGFSFVFTGTPVL